MTRPTLVRRDGTTTRLPPELPVSLRQGDLLFHEDGRVTYFDGEKWISAEDAASKAWLEVRPDGSVAWPPSASA